VVKNHVIVKEVVDAKKVVDVVVVEEELEKEDHNIIFF
jgi:hypothetical protein